ncbi:histidine-type phosphatase [Crenobacter caeni]|uniref:Histidine-type phosphatase n=1 Tax=Crenobacter caeni TaxID=2705474 RepID=A0A6B2KUC6_9NEIS|nr:histidine-type phosphatase [Crenobacter caeni]NDV13845.1 histidine-type phosphatase [Crenobacter caeni]
MRGWQRWSVVCLCALMGWPLAATADDAPLALVVLSRHGVRAPTQGADTLARWSARPWPVWTVGRGELSARGAALAETMGRAYGARLGLGLCPKPGEISLYADVDERTRATAAALARGLSAACPPRVVSASGKLDALFHPVKAGVCALDVGKARAAMLATAGGDLARYVDRQAASLVLVQQALGPTPDALCAREGARAPCTLTRLSTHIAPRRDDGHANIALAGGLALASDAAEVLMLDAVERPGYSSAGAPVLSRMLDAHVAAFGLTQWTPYLAQRRGSALLSRLFVELARAGTPGAPRLSVLVGHDTNLANVGALLGARWQAADWPVRATPPAGALVFAVYRGEGGAREVRAEYWAQPLSGLLAGGSDIAPERARVTLNACPHGACDLAALLGSMRRAADPACVP